MSMFGITDTTRCRNCGAEFADHAYVPDSIDEYKCPHAVCEGHYGYFTGGDPRDFHPDYECCSPDELENHRRACELWNDAESRGETPEPEKCPSGWIYADDGTPICHVLRAPYGIGMVTVTFETTFEAVEVDEEE